MMRQRSGRRVPSSLIWLALLFGLSVAVAIVSGAVLYWQTQASARTRAEGITHGSATAGQLAIGRYGCGGCHVIPGVAGAQGAVGPTLAKIATRAEIAGKLPNDPEAMVRWLMHPQHVSPGSGMPEMGVTERDARDMAAYLYTED